MNKTQIRELQQNNKYGTKGYAEGALRSMVESCWCYGGGVSDYEWDRYIARYYEDDDAVLTEDEVRKIVDDQLDHMNKHCRSVYAGEDSEGVTYNTIVDDTETK